jgi:hypothetical protein
VQCLTSRLTLLWHSGLSHSCLLLQSGRQFSLPMVMFSIMERLFEGLIFRTLYSKSPDMDRKPSILYAFVPSPPSGHLICLFQGPIAASIVKRVQETGGILTLEDLSGYKVEASPALMGTYRGRKIYTTDAPSCGACKLIFHPVSKFPLTPCSIVTYVEHRRTIPFRGTRRPSSPPSRRSSQIRVRLKNQDRRSSLPQLIRCRNYPKYSEQIICCRSRCKPHRC